MAERILVVDDDPVQRRRLETLVANLGYAPVVVATGDAALAALADPDQAEVACIVLDLVMPDLDGLGVLARIRQAGIAIPVIVQTAESGVDNVPSAINAGAADFVIKPVGIERLRVALRNALAHQTLIRELSRARRGGAPTLKDIAVHGASMHAVRRAAEKAAASTLPVLITGEPGVGKTFIARAIHGSGARRAKPFVVVDCAAMPPALACALLFGHEKGAMPGAAQRPGKLVEAAGGTLLLRDVDALPPAPQIKLFRAIAAGEVEPACARRPVPIDVRLISTSSRDLIADTHAGRFHEDLFYRLQTFHIAVPPLRERREEIPDLIRRFVLRSAADEGRCAPAVSAAALDQLAGFAWPGNVRQLAGAVSRAVAFADGDPLEVGDFPQCGKSMAITHGIVKDANEFACGPAGPGTAKIVSILAHARTDAPPMTSLPLLAEDGQIRSLADIEADVIRFAVNHYRRRISEVARKLGIGRATLYRKLDTLGMALNNADESSSVSIG